ncbi:MAG TPA: imidazole glycerol phosphate synthase subunit HisF [Gemmataceae bacterium]|nr:imidazole glycerol phosphate synthase subunit HisF [Gemmataceae bacterium]
MLTKRIIPCLDMDRGRVVKGIHFEQLRDAGDPVEVARRYEADGADELVFLDISATHEGRDILLETVRRVSEEVFMPFTVGGGIRTLDDATRLIQAGAEKVSVNSAAVRDPDLVTEIARKFGSCATVVNIDPKRVRWTEDGGPRTEDRKVGPLSSVLGPPSSGSNGRVAWEVFVRGGRERTGLEAVAWARRVEELGAGEIVLTSMDADGTKAGYDLEMTAAVASAVGIPVVASGGAGEPEHLAAAFRAGADAALAASIFHYDEYSIPITKRYLARQGFPIRL